MFFLEDRGASGEKNSLPREFKKSFLSHGFNTEPDVTVRWWGTLEMARIHLPSPRYFRGEREFEIEGSKHSNIPVFFRFFSREFPNANLSCGWPAGKPLTPAPLPGNTEARGDWAAVLSIQPTKNIASGSVLFCVNPWLKTLPPSPTTPNAFSKLRVLRVSVVQLLLNGIHRHVQRRRQGYLVTRR